jgi:hypothetical protein
VLEGERHVLAALEGDVSASESPAHASPGHAIEARGPYGRRVQHGRRSSERVSRVAHAEARSCGEEGMTVAPLVGALTARASRKENRHADVGHDVTAPESRRAAALRVGAVGRPRIVSPPSIEGVGLLEAKRPETRADNTPGQEKTLDVLRVGMRLLAQDFSPTNWPWSPDGVTVARAQGITAHLDTRGGLA